MITDEMIREAAEEYELALLDSLPNTKECNHVFSAQFERKMKKLCNKEKSIRSNPYLKRIACAVLVIVLSFGTLPVLNIEARATIIGWVKEQCENLVHYISPTTDVVITNKQFELGWIPNDYTLISSIDRSDGKTILYSDPEGRIIQFSYYYTLEDTNFYIGGNEYTQTQTTVGDYSAELYISQDPAFSNGIVWSMYDGGVYFQITAYCNEDTLIEMAENVFVVDLFSD